MSERRYSEDEVAEILKYAAEAENSETSHLPSARGLTLTELTDIAREAGISPEAMQLAVRKLEKPQPPTLRFLGIPIGVGQTVELDRKLTDDEWERLVADLRQTFQAHGVLKQEGSLRSWRNGNLQALLEPTAAGQRLRLQTKRGGAEAWISAGLGMFAVDFMMMASAAIKGTMADPGVLSSLVIVSGMGIAMLSLSGFGLSRWAKLRQSQMNEIADRVAADTGNAAIPDV